MLSQRSSFARLLALVGLLVLLDDGMALGEDRSLPKVSPSLVARAEREGSTRVIVKLNLGADAQDARPRSRAIGSARRRLSLDLAGTARRVTQRYEHFPLVGLEVGPDALDAMSRSPNVAQVYPDGANRPALSESVPLIQGDLAREAGYDGSGWTVAVLDTGIDSSHAFLAGRVAYEACFSSSAPANRCCPNGAASVTGAGAAQPCEGNSHGTHVTGIIASQDAVYRGVAPGARILAFQVYHRTPQGLEAFDADILKALDRTLTLNGQFQIASANLSLGDGQYFAHCDATSPYTERVEELRDAGIAVVAAAGNGGFTDSVDSPACVSAVVSIGATTKSDVVASFSNSAPIVDLLAPGVSVRSPVPGGGTGSRSGTSMAVPHVAASFALMKEKKPGASVEEIEAALRSEGRVIRDPKSGVETPRVRVMDALEALGLFGPATSSPLTGARQATRIPDGAPTAP